MMARVEYVTDSIHDIPSSESQKTVQHLRLKTSLIIHVSTYLPYEASIQTYGQREIPKLIAK
jgi:hypothetical protein